MRKTIDMFKPTKITQHLVDSHRDPTIQVSHTQIGFRIYLISGWGKGKIIGFNVQYTWVYMIDLLIEFNQILGIPFEAMNLVGSLQYTQEQLQSALNKEVR